MCEATGSHPPYSALKPLPPSHSLRHLIDLKADVNQAANDGATPAYIAAQGGNIDCIKVLSEYHANLNQPDKSDKKGLTGPYPNSSGNY